MSRNVLTLLALGAALVAPSATAQPARSPQSITDMRADDPALMAGRAELLRRAETALAGGDTTLAADTFERAALMLHAPDTEMGIVRTAMQQGRYRQALAFCAHTAGSHLESTSAGALYAWLLRVGGQTQVSNGVLRETIARAPGDAVALAALDALASAWPEAGGVLLATPQRMAPQATMTTTASDPPAEAARVMSSGVLIDGGARALVPAASVATAASDRGIWVRNGLGQTSKAHVDLTSDRTRDPNRSPDVVVLALDGPLPFEAGDGAAARDPFAGSAGFVVEYTARDSAIPAWPWLHQGFVGAAGPGGTRRLGIDVPAGPHGGPVLDVQGHVAGIAIPGPDGVAALLPVSAWPGAAKVDAGSGGAAQRVALPARQGLAVIAADEAYERGLRLALQVIVAGPAQAP